MRAYLQWTLAVLGLVGATVLPAATAQAAASPAASQSCSTSTVKDPQKLSAATVTICRDATGTVTSASGTVTDLKRGDRKCARLDIAQFWGDLEAGEYVYTTDIACGGTISFNHTSGWVNYAVQTNVFWVSGGAQG